jgi:hypothetical protein
LGNAWLLRSTLVLLMGCNLVAFGPISEVPVEIEYRQIMLGPTCMGGWRVKITLDGRVFSSRNRTHCERGQLWSSPWSADPVAILTPRTHRALLGKLHIHKLFTLPAHLTDPTKATTGGHKEEVELTDGERHHIVVAENVVQREIAAIGKALRRYAK